METYGQYIGGEWRQGTGERVEKNLNPANTDDVIGLVHYATRAETRSAIEAAVDAQKAWKRVPGPERGRVVLRAAAAMARRKEEIARMLTREEGKILRESRGEVQKAINVLEFMAGEGTRLTGQTAPSDLPFNLCYTVRVPIGVVGLITPWNFPVAIPAWKIAPAIVAGNAVVLKPSPLTPATARMVIECFEEAGLPKGVLNLVQGEGPEVGEEIVTNPKVGAISFTGSNAVGTLIYSQAAPLLKKVQCEMGGKNAAVILEDADLSLALEGVILGAFGSTGQRCTATSRVVIHEQVADRFVEQLVDRTMRLRLGDGLAEGTDVGPVVSEMQMKKDLEYIEIGRKEAKLLCGGDRPGGALAKGYFVSPTVFDHVTKEMRIAQEEIFGPIVSILRVKSFEEAIDVANSVRFGHQSAIFSSDPSRLHRFVDEVEVGGVHVNSATIGGEAHLPFGGMKATSVGTREMGSVAIDFYTELKTVYVDYTGQKRSSNIY